MLSNYKAVGIGDVIAKELSDVAMRRGRQPTDVDPSIWKEACHEERLRGICLSGGGIRSATFGLGVLQGLAEKDILQQADYLSSVSGGGYIASWLQGVLHRSGTFQVLTRTIPQPSNRDPVTFLRKYSNYLAPRLGFSLDSFVIPIIWLRNTALNQAIIYAAFAALFLALIWPGVLLGRQAHNHSLVAAIIELALAVAAGTWAVFEIDRNLRKTEARTFTEDPSTNYTPGTGTENVAWRVVFPLVLGVLLVMLSAVARRSSSSWRVSFAFLALWVLHALLQLRGGFVVCYTRRHERSWLKHLAPLQVIWMSLACALLVLGLFIGVEKLLLHSNPLHPAGSQLIVAFGPPLYLISLMIGISLQIGLMGIDFPDASREWLARAGALLGVIITFWAAFFGIAVFAPVGLALLWAKSGAMVLSGAGTWVSSTIATVLAGKSGKTGNPDPEQKPNRTLDLIARYGPFIAIPGFLVAVACVVQGALFLPLWLDGHPLSEFLIKYWDRFSFAEPRSVTYAVIFLLGAIAVTVLFSLRVNINEFSLHYFYKNRLVRCYLGASHGARRRPDSFTGFDPRDDIPLQDLRCIAPRTAPGAPYPLLNACLNVTAGTELATQQRKGLSFTFSPWFCGFVPFLSDADESVNKEIANKGYVNSACFLSGIHLGTAFSISGAAVSPNRGFHSSPQTAFLLTLFNARLGWWAGNPRDKRTWTRPGPLFALHWLFLELLGFVTQRSGYINLSDGGHFENLGLYELIRRRCHTIIAVDAEEDPNYIFESLGEAVRKCRADFGIEIRIDTRAIRPMDNHSRMHYAVGRIYYPEPGTEPGWLLYLKSSITGDEPADVEEYWRENPAFPQQSTMNQFFSESEFESYRRLGLHVARSVLPDGAEPWTDQWFEQVAAASQP